MTIRSSVLDRTCPNPNFRCSTWAPWEYVLEAIEFLRLLLGCSAGGMTCRLGMDGMFGQLYHGDGSNVSKSGAICRAGRFRCQGKVEMSPSRQNRNVPFSLGVGGVHVNLRVPVKRRRAMLASNPIKE